LEGIVPNTGEDPGAPREPLDGDKIRQKFRGNDEEKLDAVVEFHFEFAVPSCEWIKRKFRRRQLQPFELTAIWSEVLYAVYRMAKNDKIHEHDEWDALIHTIAERKAIDCLRKLRRCRDDDRWDVTQFAMEDFFDEVEFDELLSGIRDGISRIKGLKGVVLKLRWDLFLDKGYPPSLEVLFNEFIDRRLGCATIWQIKGWLQHGREELRAYLVARGLIDERR
jgi:hypothetical protein